MTDIVISLDKAKEGLKLVESSLGKFRPLARLKAVEALDLFFKGLSGCTQIREGSFLWALIQMMAGKRVRRKGHRDMVRYMCIVQKESDKEPRLYVNLDGPGDNPNFQIPNESILENDWVIVPMMKLFRFEDKDGAIYTIAAKDLEAAQTVFALNLVEEGRENEDVGVKVNEYEDGFVFTEGEDGTDKSRKITAKELAAECKIETIVYCSEW